MLARVLLRIYHHTEFEVPSFTDSKNTTEGKIEARTDRQTDTHDDSIYRASIASRGKNNNALKRSAAGLPKRFI